MNGLKSKTQKMERPKWDDGKFQELLNMASNEFYHGGIVTGKFRAFYKYEIPCNSYEDACKIICLAYEIDDKEDIMGLNQIIAWEQVEDLRSAEKAERMLEEKDKS